MNKAELITGSEINDRWTRENWRIGATAPKTGETVWLVLNDFNEAPRRGHWYAVDNCWLAFDGYAVERYLDRAVLCWRPVKEEADSAVSSEIVTEPAAKRVTTIHVIDANSNQHDYMVWHANDLRIWEMGDGRIDVGEIDEDGQPKGSVASFPSSWAVVLRENVLDPALTDMCMDYARAVAEGLRDGLGDVQHEEVEQLKDRVIEIEKYNLARRARVYSSHGSALSFVLGELDRLAEGATE